MNPYDEYKLISERAVVDQLFYETLTGNYADFLSQIEKDTVKTGKLIASLGLYSKDELCCLVEGLHKTGRVPDTLERLTTPFLMHCQCEKGLHRVDGAHILCPYCGNFILSIDGHDQSLPLGTLAIVAPNIPHSYKPTADKTDNHLMLNCILSPDFHNPILDASEGRSPLHLFLHSKNDPQRTEKVLTLDVRQESLIVHYLTCAILEYDHARPFAIERAAAYLTLFFSSVAALSEASTENSPIRFSEMIIDYMSQNMRSVTLGSMAKHFHFHPNYLSRLIRTNTGCSFSDLLQTIRVKNAAVLLLETELSVSQIAEKTGYSNLSFFYRKFSQYYNCTPAQYRDPKNRD